MGALKRPVAARSIYLTGMYNDGEERRSVYLVTDAAEGQANEAELGV
jgi:hypothetical protein